MAHDPFVPHYTRRPSAVPRAIGVLAMVFSCIGLGMAILFTWGPLHDLRHHEPSSLNTWLYVFALVSFVLFAVHLTGGILAAMNRTLGLRLLTGYAVGALVLLAIDLVFVLAIAPSGHRVWSSLTMPHVFYSALVLPWPVLVLIFANLKRSRETCR
ncbi:MAG: hypothetical protein ABI867_28115 [Kofleriaceae bacterium]